MFETFYQLLNWLFGLSYDQNTLTFLHMVPRAIVVYALGILLVRLGKRRFLGKPTAFDLILALIFGSVMSRAITGNAPFFPTLGIGCVLIGLHSFFSYLTFYSSFFGTLLKGQADVLIKDGHIQWANMKKQHISKRDLLSALRRNAKLTEPVDVKLAVLERSGEISVIPYPTKPLVVEVTVEKGVEKVRVELAPCIKPADVVCE